MRPHVSLLERKAQLALLTLSIGALLGQGATASRIPFSSVFVCWPYS